MAGSPPVRARLRLFRQCSCSEATVRRMASQFAAQASEDRHRFGRLRFYWNGDDNRFLFWLGLVLARKHQSGSDIARLGRTMGRIDRRMRQMPPGAGWGDEHNERGYSKS